MTILGRHAMVDDLEIPNDVSTSSVRTLLDELGRRGYVISDQRYDEGTFGNALLVLERVATRVRLVRDRGQWFLDVASTTEPEWFPPVVWHAFLESSMSPLETAGLDAQSALLLGDLDRIEVAASVLGERELAALRAWRSRHAASRRALLPTLETDRPGSR